MDCFRKVTSWHVSKLFQVELLQVFSKENKSYIGIMKIIKEFHKESQGVSHVAWSPPPPPHYLAWKGQKPNQLLNLWITFSTIVPKEYHQDQIIAYQTFISSKDVVLLYSKHKALCCSCNCDIINCFMCLSSDWVQWNMQVYSLSIIFIKALYTIWTTFQLACALSAINPLKLGFARPNFNITFFHFVHMTHWTFVDSGYM